jgi:hypothetical protein
MKRRTLDIVLSITGVVMAVTVGVAGGLLLWGHNYVTNQVRDQLVAQQIVFPAANSPAISAPEFAPMKQYAGQTMSTGDQARVYANYFIANHLQAIGGGKTYSQLSAEAQTSPNNAALAGQVQTMFRGETLRGLLLNAYAFGTMGKLMGYAALVAFGASALLLVLSILGLFHASRATTEIRVGQAEPTLEPATV